MSNFALQYVCLCLVQTVFHGVNVRYGDAQIFKDIQKYVCFSDEQRLTLRIILRVSYNNRKLMVFRTAWQESEFQSKILVDFHQM